MIKYCCTTILLSCSLFLMAQDRAIYFDLSFNDQPIEINKSYYSPAIEDEVYFEAIRLYISNIAFFQNEKEVYSLKKKHILVDVEKPESMLVDLSEFDMDFNRIKFNIGVDSTTNMAGAFGGDLDPANGMYWTWQSGYINVKIEGVTKACPARKNQFQFHLGGYQYPYNNLQIVDFSIANDGDIHINIAIDQFLKHINLQEEYQVMSPSRKSVELAGILSNACSINNELK